MATLFGWGRNTGHAVSPVANTPVVAEPVRVDAGGAHRRIVQVACGHGFTLAVDENGDVLAWGLGGSGQLGQGRSVPVAKDPVRVTLGGLGSRRVVCVVAGDATAAAVTSEGELFEWGFMHAALLDGGAGANPGLELVGLSRGAAHMSDRLKDLLRRSTILYLTAGGRGHSDPRGERFEAGGHAAAGAAADGAADAADDDDARDDADQDHTHELDPAVVDAEAGILAVRTRRRAVYTPTKSRFALPVVGVALGHGHTLVRTRDGALFARGYCDRGQLGNGTRINTYAFEPVLGPLRGQPVSAVACGSSHSLAVLPDGSVYAWGSNALGQLGLGSEYSDQLLPCKLTSFAAASPATGVAAGSYHSVIHTRDGEVFSFGHSEYSQHGDRVDESARDFRHMSRHFFVPQPVEPFSRAGGVRARSVGCGAHYSAALVEGGKVYTWGYGAFGVLGHARYMGVHAQPVQALLGYEAVQVSAGHQHVFALVKPLGAPFAATFAPLLVQAVAGAAVGAAAAAVAPDAGWVTVEAKPVRGDTAVATSAAASTAFETGAAVPLVRVHLFLLRARCPALLELTGADGVVRIPEHVERRVLAALVEFLYTDVVTTCPPHRLVNLAALARALRMDRLAAVCELLQFQFKVSRFGDAHGAAVSAPASVPGSTFVADMDRALAWAQAPAFAGGGAAAQREGLVVFRLTASSAAAEALAPSQSVSPPGPPPPPPGHTAYSWFHPGSDAAAAQVRGHTRFSLGPRTQDASPSIAWAGAHRAVLSRYKFFNVMLDGSFAEGSATREGRPVALEVDPATFFAVLRWAYTGTEALIRDDTVVALVEAASRFGVDDLRRACERYLGARATPENAAQMFELSRAFAMARLRRHCAAVLTEAGAPPADDDEDVESEEVFDE